MVLALTCSLSSRDLHEVLFEDLLECSFPNKLSPSISTTQQHPVGAVTYVMEQAEHVSGDVEAVTVRTIGIKNCDVHRELKDVDLPTGLFTSTIEELRPAALETLLAEQAPLLSKKIVCIADRKIYRQTPKHVPFLL